MIAASEKRQWRPLLPGSDIDEPRRMAA